MNKPTVLRGRARVIPISDVDTDMIFHNKHLHITNPTEMGQFIFANLKGWESFPSDVHAGDILVVGHNFGCGSSRQQAVDGLTALSVAGIVGESFGAIYKRNAINAGWPLIESPGILVSGVKDGDEIEVDLMKGTVKDAAGITLLRGKPMTEVQREIYQAGGLLELV